MVTEKLDFTKLCMMMKNLLRSNLLFSLIKCQRIFKLYIKVLLRNLCANT